MTLTLLAAGGVLALVLTAPPPPPASVALAMRQCLKNDGYTGVSIGQPSLVTDDAGVGRSWNAQFTGTGREAVQGINPTPHRTFGPGRGAISVSDAGDCVWWTFEPDNP